MKRIPLFFLAISVLLSSACSEDVLRVGDPDEYVTFGDFFGECIGDGCIDIYQVTSKHLLRDTLDNYPSTLALPHGVVLVPTGNNRYEEILGLIGDIPADLFDETELVIGQPDAGDWGGFYLETNVSGEVRYWLIDKMEDNLPPYLVEFTKRLEVAIGIAGS